MERQALATAAWQALAPALGADIELIRHEVDNGQAQLIAWGDGELFTVTRGEHSAEGKELVIVAAAGRNMTPYIQQIHESAKAQGYYSVRVHTKRPKAMLKISQRAALGYQPQETILRAVL